MKACLPQELWPGILETASSLAGFGNGVDHTTVLVLNNLADHSCLKYGLCKQKHIFLGFQSLNYVPAG